MDFSKMDLQGKSLGELIRNLEINGELGHFKSCGLFQATDSEGSMLITTRDFWIEAGVNPTVIFKHYLGTLSRKIESITDSLTFIKPVLDCIANKLMDKIRTTSTDLMLKKLFILYENTNAFYRKDHASRKVVADFNGDISIDTLESNCSIVLALLDGLSIMIENCVVFQHDDNSHSDIKTSATEELFDCDLLVETYLYSLLSQYYTMLNLSKNSRRNYSYCSGVYVNPNDIIPIEGLIDHPLVYTSVMIGGNQNVFEQEDIKSYCTKLNVSPIGQGFHAMYGFGILEVIGAFHVLEKQLPTGYAAIVSVDELKRYIYRNIRNVIPEALIKHFSITKSKLQSYISEREPYIFRVGCNQFRLDIRPIVLLDNGLVYISRETLFRSKNLWLSYATNGGRPYTGIDAGQGDAVIDGFAKREEELGNKLVDILFKKLEQHYPCAKYKSKNVQYDRIFGKNNRTTEIMISYFLLTMSCFLLSQSIFLILLRQI